MTDELDRLLDKHRDFVDRVLAEPAGESDDLTDPCGAVPSCLSPFGRDLTGQDVRDAAMKWLKETSDPYPYEYIAAHLNRITRPTGDTR